MAPDLNGLYPKRVPKPLTRPGLLLVMKLIYTQEINNQDQLFKIDLVNRASEQLTHIARGFLRSNEKGDWFDPAYALPVSPQPQLLTTLWGKVKQE